MRACVATAPLACRRALAEALPSVLHRSASPSWWHGRGLAVQPQHGSQPFCAAERGRAAGGRPPTPPIHRWRRRCPGLPARCRRVFERVRRVAGERLFSLRTTRDQPSQLGTVRAATPHAHSPTTTILCVTRVPYQCFLHRRRAHGPNSPPESFGGSPARHGSVALPRAAHATLQ